MEHLVKDTDLDSGDRRREAGAEEDGLDSGTPPYSVRCGQIY
jgi:hypothetical protein